jgi:hypothetical protein
MPDMLQLMIAPFVASMVLVAMLAYLGVHIIARGVIFVDLALAQMAALGATFGLLFHVGPDSPLSYAFALGFTTLGALVFAITRERRTDRVVPQEAIIGIVYIVATAAALLIADRTPAGGEAIKDVMMGSLLWVTWPDIGRIALVYSAVGVLQWLLRKRFLTISLHLLSSVRGRDHVRRPARRGPARVHVSRGSGSRRLPVYARYGRPGRHQLGSGSPGFCRRPEPVFQVRSADGTADGVHVRALAPGCLDRAQVGAVRVRG